MDNLSHGEFMSLSNLAKKYPEAFKYKSPRYAFQLYGFQILDGWAKVIEPMAKYLQCHNSRSDDKIYIAQIKEKFGGLRFYVHTPTPELIEIIDMAHELSFKVCEICGEPGKLRHGRILKTTCNAHRLVVDGLLSLDTAQDISES
jgi:hypothetical protein